MRLLAPVLIILILVLGALIALRMVRTANRKKVEWSQLSERATLAEQTIGQIDKEVSLAQTANIPPDGLILNSIIDEYNTKRSGANSKEIAR